MSDLKIKNKMLRSIFIKTLEAEGISLKEYLDSLNIDAFDDVNEYLNNEKLFFQINTVDFFLNNLLEMRKKQLMAELEEEKNKMKGGK